MTPSTPLFCASPTALDRPKSRWAAVLVLAMLAICAGLGGCVYRIDIQQGNFLESKDIDRVTVGMTRVQVRALLGTPMVADPFEGWRWDYVYYLKRGHWEKPQQRHFIVFFEEDKVIRIDRPDPGKSTVQAKN